MHGCRRARLIVFEPHAATTEDVSIDLIQERSHYLESVRDSTIVPDSGDDDSGCLLKIQA